MDCWNISKARLSDLIGVNNRTSAGSTSRACSTKAEIKISEFQKQLQLQPHQSRNLLIPNKRALLSILGVTMSTSPTPEEREKKDAEARAKEATEQAQLPYKWTQTISDLDITIPVPTNLRGRDLDVSITKTHLKAGVKGQTPIMDVIPPNSSPFYA